jgi:hypothetical protein
VVFDRVLDGNASRKLPGAVEQSASERQRDPGIGGRRDPTGDVRQKRNATPENQQGRH